MSHDNPSDLSIRPILAHYAASLQPLQTEYLEGAGGFSGAEFWRLKTAAGDLCLRRWPQPHPSFERLSQTHQVLCHAAARSVEFLPVPLQTRAGQTIVDHGQRFWELTPWLAGEGNFFREPRPEKLQAALVALARFHRATSDFPSPECRVAPSPGISARLVQLRTWTPGELSRLRRAIDAVGRVSNPSVTSVTSHIQGADAPRSLDGRIGNPSYYEIITRFEQLAPRIERELLAVERTALPLQPVIRDVWADHFLFTGDAVTGLVDFGGLNIDTPATDIARLLGSLAGDDRAAWATGLAAYETARPLASPERELIPVFDHSTVVLSGMNWLRWIYLEQRTFNNLPVIEDRLQAILTRMRAIQS